MANAVKRVILVGLDDSNHSYHALEWAIDIFFAPFGSNPPFKLIVVHARPTPTSVLGIAGPGSLEAVPMVEQDLKNTAHRVISKAKEICKSKSVECSEMEIVEGDARNVMVESVERYHASVLVLGSHGYGAVKRLVLGSVSDYCAHHAHCSVMIAKRPKVAAKP